MLANKPPPFVFLTDSFIMLVATIETPVLNVNDNSFLGLLIKLKVIFPWLIKFFHSPLVLASWFWL